MLKIIDNTTKQKLSAHNIDFWDDALIKESIISQDSIRNGKIYINDYVVERYNKKMNYIVPKSNASFVREVRRLNKLDFFDK